MAMALRYFFTCLVMTVCIVASVDATISCFSVAFRLAPCVDYLRNGGDAPPSLCCYGVKTLNDMAQTTPDRQQACECMKSNSKLIPGLNETIAAGLPAKCGVNIPYPISLKTDCNTVK